MIPCSILPASKSTYQIPVNERLLLNTNNVDINARDIDGKSPLDYTKQYNFKKMAELLEEHGAS